MNLPLSSLPKTKIGTCPHGLPAGACPICSGMGGGGGGSKPKVASPNEMSWDECYAVGQMMKAQKLAQQQRDKALQNEGMAMTFGGIKANSFAQKIANLAETIALFTQKPTNLPKILEKSINFVANKLLVPMLNVLKDISQVIQKSVDFVKEKLADISDKLNAVFGELKNSLEKKISDKFNNFKKKTMSLLGLLVLTDEDLQIQGNSKEETGNRKQKQNR